MYSMNGLSQYNKLKHDMKRDLAEVAAVIGFYLGIEKIKVGSEGVMFHYDLIVTIAEKFCEKFPESFNWEKHYLKGGDDWDIECENFVKEYIEKNSIPTNHNFF